MTEKRRRLGLVSVALYWTAFAICVVSAVTSWGTRRFVINAVCAAVWFAAALINTAVNHD